MGHSGTILEHSNITIFRFRLTSYPYGIWFGLENFQEKEEKEKLCFYWHPLKEESEKFFFSLIRKVTCRMKHF